MARERARPSLLGCVTVFGLLLGGICGCGLGLGLLLHWLIPAIDRGTATLCGLVATGVALLAFGQLMTLAEPLEEEPLGSGHLYVRPPLLGSVRARAWLGQ